MSELEAGGAPAPADTPAIDTSPPPVGAAPEAPKEPEREPTMDDTLNAAWDKAQTGSERGEDGKFTPETTETPAVQPETAPEPVKPAIEAPQSWTAEAKAEWAKLPPSTQEYILRREGEAHKAITTQGERLKSFEPLERVLTEYRDDFARNRISPEDGIRALLDAQRMFEADPIGAATTLLLKRGIDLRPFLQGQQGTLPASDPRVGQLDHELRSLKQTLETTLQQQAEQQAAADVAVVQEFAKDKPYFEDVRTFMATLMKDGHAETLQAAYDMAVRAHPSVSKRIEADQRKAMEEKRKSDEAAKQAELKKRAEDAAKSAKVNVKSGTAHPSTKTMDDTLAEIARRAYG